MGPGFRRGDTFIFGGRGGQIEAKTVSSISTSSTIFTFTPIFRFLRSSQKSSRHRGPEKRGITLRLPKNELILRH